MEFNDWYNIIGIIGIEVRAALAELKNIPYSRKIWRGIKLLHLYKACVCSQL